MSIERQFQQEIERRNRGIRPITKFPACRNLQEELNYELNLFLCFFAVGLIILGLCVEFIK
jgi:hypothetical protein